MPVTTETATNPSLRNWDPRVGLAYRSFQRSQDFHPRQLRHVPQRDLFARSELLAAAAVSHRDADLCAGPGLSLLFSNLGPDSDPLAVPTNGSLSVTNGDFYGVHSTPYQMQWNFTIQRESSRTRYSPSATSVPITCTCSSQEDFNYPPTAVWRRDRGVSIMAGRLSAAQPGFPTFASNPQYNSLQLRITGRLALSSAADQPEPNDSRRLAGAGLLYILEVDRQWLRHLWIWMAAESPPIRLVSRLDRGLSNFNRTHNFRVSGTYSGALSRSKGFVGQVVNGWQLTGVFRLSFRRSGQSDFRHQPRIHRHGLRTPAGRTVTRAATCIPDSKHIAAAWFNPGCFTLQPQGTYGNAGTRHIIGPESVEPGRFAHQGLAG